MLTSFMPEWHDETVRWVDAVVKAAAADSEANQKLLSDWSRLWTDRVQAALAPVAEIALGDQWEDALTAARNAVNARMTKAGLTV